MSAENQEKPGVFRSIFKVIIAFIFFGFGTILVTIGAISIAKNLDQGARWVSILNIVFGSLLLISPFLLNEKRKGFWWVFKIIMIIIFLLCGAALIIGNSIALAKNWYPNDKWFPIISLIFGCLLFTSPFFLKK